MRTYRKVGIRLLISVLVVSILFGQREVLAQSTSRNCEAVRWPFKSAADEVKLKDLENVERPSLYSYLYFELTQKPQTRIPGLAKRLMFFLKNTELNNDRAMMLEAIEYAARIDSDTPNVFVIQDLCGIDRKAASTTSPTSSKSRKKK